MLSWQDKDSRMHHGLSSLARRGGSAVHRFAAPMFQIPIRSSHARSDKAQVAVLPAIVK